MTVEEILRKLPKFNQTEDRQTFSPYDINAVDSDLVVKNSEPNQVSLLICTVAVDLFAFQGLRVYIAIALGLVSTVTLTILVGFCIYVRRQRVIKSGL